MGIYMKTLFFVVIAVVVLMLLVYYGKVSFERLVEGETGEVLAAVEGVEEELFLEEEITDLPEPVQKWLLRSGAIGRNKVIKGRVTQKALMKLKPEQSDWYGATATQYTTIDVPAFIWTVDVKMNSLISFKGRDKFVNGKGEMLIKLNSLLSVVNETGEKLDEGTIQRFLGELVWFPTLAVSPYIKWEQIDEFSAEAKMEYMGTSGSGTFYFNEEGDFIKFIALRFQGNEPDSERKEWVLTVDDYKVFDGIKVPSQMKATWILDDLEWTWLELEIVDMEYNSNAL
jgi:hypothetical protein